MKLRNKTIHWIKNILYKILIIFKSKIYKKSKIKITIIHKSLVKTIIRTQKALITFLITFKTQN